MAYELTIARLMVEHGPFPDGRYKMYFRLGVETAAKDIHEQRRRVLGYPLTVNAFSVGYRAFTNALGEVSDGV